MKQRSLYEELYALKILRTRPWCLWQGIRDAAEIAQRGLWILADDRQSMWWWNPDRAGEVPET